MIRHLIAVIGMIGALQSCSMIPMMLPPNLSRQEPYKAHVGNTVYLREGNPLWVEGGGEDYLNTISPYDPQGSGTLERIPLSKGQPFYLQEVRHRVGSGVSVVQLLGRVNVRGRDYQVEVSGGNYQYRFETELPFTSKPPH